MTGLKELRVEAGLTQRGLADAAGVSENTIQKLEYGSVFPSVETLGVLRRVLGSSVFRWLNDILDELDRKAAVGHDQSNARGRPKRILCAVVDPQPDNSSSETSSEASFCGVKE